MVLGADTIRTVSTPFGVFTAAERAAADTRRIEEAARTFLPAVDTLAIRWDESNVQLFFGDQPLVTITPRDAAAAGTSPAQLAERIRARTVQAIADWHHSRNIWVILRQLGLALAVAVALGAAMWGNGLLFRKKLLPWLQSKQTKWFNGFTVRGFEVLDPERQAQAVRWVLLAVKWALNLAMTYAALLALFSIFPLTQRFAAALFGWVWNPLKGILIGAWNFIPNLLTIVVVLVVVKYVVRWIKRLSVAIQTGKLTLPGFYPDWAHTTYTLIRTALYVLAFIFIYPYLPGADNKVFQGVSVLIGVVVSLGSTSVVSNLMGGLVITYMRPFLRGDYVKVGDVTGTVVEKTPVVTRIETFKKELVTIPNAQVLSGNVVNYTAPTRGSGKGVALSTSITIGYDTPWRSVHEMMLTAAGRTAEVESTPAPYVLQKALDNSYVAYQLCAYTLRPEDMHQIYSDLHKNLQDVFAEHGVEILSPEYRAEREANRSTVPPIADDPLAVAESSVSNDGQKQTNAG